MGYKPRLDWLPCRRGYSMTRNGTYMANFPFLKTPERERDFLYSEAIFSDKSYLWTRVGESLSAEDLSGFSGKTICVPLGFHSPMLVVLSALIERNEVHIERPESPDKCLQMLAAGRVDTLSGSETAISSYIRNNRLDGKIVHGPAPLSQLDFYVIFSRKVDRSEKLVRRFNETLRKMKEDGTYSRLMTD
jgi:polar amino acid transport system substrate-binding protein